MLWQSYETESVLNELNVIDNKCWMIFWVHKLSQKGNDHPNGDMLCAFKKDTYRHFFDQHFNSVRKLKNSLLIIQNHTWKTRLSLMHWLPLGFCPLKMKKHFEHASIWLTSGSKWILSMGANNVRSELH